MISGKSLFILCLGLLVASQAKNLDVELYDAELEGIVEEAEKLFKQFSQTVANAIAAAVESLKGFLGEIGSAAAEFESVLNSTLVAAIGPFIKQIENGVAAAAAAGVNVAECTGDSITEITDLPAQLLRNVTSCIADKVNEANDVINRFIDDVQNTTNVVLDLGNKIRDCENGGFIHAAICLAGVTGQITLEIAKLPIKISGDVIQAGKFIATAIPSFAACDFGAHTAIVFEAGAIAGNVTQCIKEKMSSSNSTTTPDSSDTTTSASSDVTTCTTDTTTSAYSESTTSAYSDESTVSTAATTSSSDVTTSTSSDETTVVSTAATTSASSGADTTEAASSTSSKSQFGYEPQFLKLNYVN